MECNWIFLNLTLTVSRFSPTIVNVQINITSRFESLRYQCIGSLSDECFINITSKFIPCIPSHGRDFSQSVIQSLDLHQNCQDYTKHILNTRQQQQSSTQSLYQSASNTSSDTQQLNQSFTSQSQSMGPAIEPAEFRFPTSIPLHSKYVSLEHIMTVIAQDQRTLGLPPYKKYFRKTENKNEGRMRLKCKFCSAVINFIELEDGIHLKKYNIEHQHKPVPNTYNKRIEAAKKMIELKNMNIDSMDSSLQKSLNLSSKHSHLLKKQIRKVDLFNYAHQPFIQILDKDGIYYYEEWIDPANKKNGTFPDVIVLASPTMRQFYADYGDVMYFESFRDIILNVSADTSSYSVGIFWGEDSNRRAVLFGIAIFSEDTYKHYETLYRKYFELMCSCPQTIILNENDKFSEETLEALKSEGIFKGIHLLNVREKIKKVVNTIKSKFDLDQDPNLRNDMIKFAVGVKTLIMEKSVQNAMHQLSDMNCMIEDKSNIIQNLLLEVISHTEKYCYWMQKQPHYIGLSRQSNQKENQSISKVILEKSKVQLNLHSFYEMMVQLQKQIVTRVNREFHACKRSVEEAYKDQKLERLSCVVEKKIFKVFFKNYVDARQKFDLEEIHCDIGKYEYKFRNKMNNEEQRIVDWSCECLQFQKTGIPCAHLILLAMKCGNIEYIELINTRWIKKMPEVQTRYRNIKAALYNDRKYLLEIDPLLASRIENPISKQIVQEIEAMSQSTIHLKHQLLSRRSDNV